MALPALGVRAKHRKWAVQYNYSSSNADPGGISPFFGFFFFSPQQNQLNEELELLVGHEKRRNTIHENWQNKSDGD